MGIDIVEIEELKMSIEKMKRFRERVFTEQEIIYCESKMKNKFASYAARFAAKEAVMKALGTGWHEGVQWNQIEVVFKEKQNQVFEYKNKEDIQHINSGIPEIHLKGIALQIAEQMETKKIVSSLSHTRHYAVASVLFEK